MAHTRDIFKHLFTPNKIFNINNSKHIYTSSHLNDKSPLAGIRVLDLTRIVAGPYCTMILGDLGAEILKIERPGAGDESRHWGPPFLNTTKDSTYYLSVNRNKKSICIDLKRGRDIIYELAEKSDVLVENYVPGKLSKMGLGYENLSKIAPHLVYCSLTAYGSDGPYRHRPGYDVIAASIGGLLHITGPKNGAPCKIGVAMTDIATGLYAHGAIMAALLQRVKTNHGQWIQCNLLSTQVACLINVASNYLNANKEASRWGSEHESIVPYEAFQTKDGFMTIGTGSDEQFINFTAKIHLPELATDLRFKTNTSRVKNRDELLTILREKLVTKTNMEWSKIFEESSFPYGPINTIKEVFDDPHLKFIEVVQEVEHPQMGQIKFISPAVKYSYGTNKIRLPAPTLGEHTIDVLSHILNYSDNKIKCLIENKIVQ